MNKVFIVKRYRSLSKTEFDFLLSLCENEKKEKILRKKKMEDRENSVLGNAIAKYAIKKIFKTSVSDIFFLYEENGKPYFKDGIFFSISHSGEMIVCVVSDKPVGIDIQKEKEISQKTSEYITGNADCDLKEFFKLWTKREAVYKKNGSILKLNSEKVKYYYMEGYYICVTE